MRARRGSRSEGFIVLFALVAGSIYMFFKENWDTILVVLYVFGGLAFIVIASILISKIVKRTKRKKAYQQTDYFKETGIPYSVELEERGVKFEIECYNKIRQTIGPHYPMLTDLLIPQVNAINKDSQIDLILFHINGIFVIEMKNYSGPLIGSLDDDRWIPYLAKRKKGKHGTFEDSYEKNWGLYDQVAGVWKPLNPVKQNAVHIETLQKLFPSKYVNTVILSDSMFISAESVKSMIENVMSLDDFINRLQTETPILGMDELRDLFQKIKNVDRRNDPKAKLLHIARVKSIEQSRTRKH
jgi:hypothetical protein